MTPAALGSSVTTLPFSTLPDEEVKEILRQYKIGLTVSEARKVSELLGRDPTLVEAVIWGIQGSEHCSYKSSRRFLAGFPTESAHVILGPKEDSGIVAITDAPKGKRWGIVISHESHNHPSQIVPFEGAATGIGGVVRDVLCMGARIVGCMDMLRLGDLKTKESRTIAKEVIRGIAGYGNPLGIPNLGGDTVFDASYNSNCLVNAIALGIVREDEIIHSYVPKEAGKVGYDIIIVGKPTDRSGFGGASFASASMEEDKREQNTGAVQEPNPFLERHLLASTYALFDWLAAEQKLDKVSFKDLGAGGIVCASVEQVADQGFGALVELGDVHVSIPNLPPEVIACAETQERFCWICHPDLTENIIKHYNVTWDLPCIAENARASVIGKVTESDLYILTYNGEVICEARARDMTCGIQYERPIVPKEFNGKEPEITCEGNIVSYKTQSSKLKTQSLSEIFIELLSHPNNASKSPALLHYDKNVIGNGVLEAGEADAGVIAPLQDLKSYVHQRSHPDWEIEDGTEWTGVAVAADGNGRYGRISPYWQGVNAALESMRNVVAVGAVPRALTDCLNYGNPEIPEQLWELAEGVRGIADAAENITFAGERVAVISGNVSLYNGRPDGSAIDPTAIVCTVGVMPDARKAITMQLKKPDSSLYLIGTPKDECGGSRYYEILDTLGANVPQPDFATAQKQMQTALDLIAGGNILACHDISEGGIVMALFEMTLPQRKLGGSIGVDIDLKVLKSDLRSDVLLFSETGGFILEGPAGLPLPCIGTTTATQSVIIRRGDTVLIDETIQNAYLSWNSGLDQALTN